MCCNSTDELPILQFGCIITHVRKISALELRGSTTVVRHPVKVKVVGSNPTRGASELNVNLPKDKDKVDSET